MALTDTKLRALRPRDAVYRVADANGLAIQVTPAGSRLWRYRFAGKASILDVTYPIGDGGDDGGEPEAGIVGVTH